MAPGAGAARMATVTQSSDGPARDRHHAHTFFRRFFSRSGRKYPLGYDRPVDAHAWDERYAASDLVWSSTPNQWVAEVCAPLTPGRALDIAAGEGRNAIWLAERGWQVVATDFSPVAVARVTELAQTRLGVDAARLEAVVADATAPQPGGPAAYDLVVLCYVQLPAPQWQTALARAVEATAPGGLVVVVLHSTSNLDGGFGGPKDPAVLYDPEAVVADTALLPVDLERADLVTRVVEDADGRHEALDTLVLLRARPLSG